MKTLDYVTTTGKQLKLKAVHPSLINRLTSGIALPERPYYSREIAGGEVEKIYHDETSLQTPDEFKAWEQYQAAMSDVDDDFYRRKIKLYIRHGVEVELPEGAELVAYVEDVCIGTMTDVIAIMRGVDKLSLIDVEALAEVEKLFRGQMEGTSA